MSFETYPSTKLERVFTVLFVLVAGIVQSVLFAHYLILGALQANTSSPIIIVILGSLLGIFLAACAVGIEYFGIFIFWAIISSIIEWIFEGE